MRPARFCGWGRVYIPQIPYPVDTLPPKCIPYPPQLDALLFPPERTWDQRYPTPPENRLTDAWENITLTQLVLRAVKIPLVGPRQLPKSLGQNAKSNHWSDSASRQ